MAIDHALPGQCLHLGPLGSALGEARTTALVKTDRFEAVRLVLKAGTKIPAHAVPGYISLHCIEGDVDVEATGTTTLQPGDWMYLDRGQQHSLTSAKDSTLLLTIYFD